MHVLKCAARGSLKTQASKITQKLRKNSPSAHHSTTLSGYNVVSPVQPLPDLRYKLFSFYLGLLKAKFHYVVLLATSSQAGRRAR